MEEGFGALGTRTSVSRQLPGLVIAGVVLQDISKQAIQAWRFLLLQFSPKDLFCLGTTTKIAKSLNCDYLLFLAHAQLLSHSLCILNYLLISWLEGTGCLRKAQGKTNAAPVKRNQESRACSKAPGSPGTGEPPACREVHSTTPRLPRFAWPHCCCWGSVLTSPRPQHYWCVSVLYLSCRRGGTGQFQRRQYTK